MSKAEVASMEQNNEKSIKVIKPPSGWGTRHTLVLLGFLGYAVSYAMRFNLSLAIVAMVKHTRVHHHHHENNTENNNNTDVMKTGTYCERDNNLAYNDNDESLGEFDWNEAEQGLILGSFFWGYFLTQLPGGMLAQRYGAKWVLGLGLFIAAVFTFLTPFAARQGQIWLIVIRVIEGLGEGVTFPAGQVLLSKWIPAEERSKLATIVYSGISIGAAVTMLCSGFLIESFGWDSVFYATGIVSTLWFFAWCYFIHENPTEHPNVSPEEKAYIVTSSNQSGNNNNNSDNKLPTPWLKILTSLPVLSICMGQIAFAWGLYTLLIELPTYLKTVLHFDIKQNSLISSGPYLCMFIVGTSITSIGDKLIQKKICSTVFCRKLCNTIALYGTALALISAAYFGCNTVITIICLNLAVGLTGVTFGGCLVSSMDIAPNFAGVITGIANSLANICGFTAPYVAGLLISGNPSIEQWRLVFFISATFLIIGNTAFLLFGSASLQSWNSDNNDEEQHKNEFNSTARRLSSTSFQL